MNSFLYIGFDLATTTTGVAVVLEKTREEQLPFCFELDFGGWEQIQKQGFKINQLNSFIDDVCLAAKINQASVCVVIELSNFSNPELTQKFAFIAGMIIQQFNNSFKGTCIHFKLVNANSWFQIVYSALEVDDAPKFNKLTRQERKQWSIQAANDLIDYDPDIELDNRIIGLENWTKKHRPTTDNESDALLMCLYFWKLTDTYQNKAIKKAQKRLKG